MWGQALTGPVYGGLSVGPAADLPVGANRHETQVLLFGRIGGFACQRVQRRQIIVRVQVTLPPALVPYGFSMVPPPGSQ
jgi:hypothetical protein